MSVRLAQAQSMIPRPGVAARSPAMSPARENAKSTPGGRAAPGGANAKGAGAQSKGAGRSEGAEGARREGLQVEESTGAQGGAQGAGFEGTADSLEGNPGRGRFELLQGEGRSELPPPAARLPPPAVVPEPRQQRVERREEASTQRQMLHGRARLRALVAELLLQGLTEVGGQLDSLLENPHPLRVVYLTQVLSESSVTLELWTAACGQADYRASLARTLGMEPEVADAQLLGSLMSEVHEGFVEFQASRPGREAWKRYEEMLQGCEALDALPVVLGHETGPMLAELNRLGLTTSLDFIRSLLVHPLVLAVGFASDEDGPQVLVEGLEVLELATLVAHLRQLNPVLSNRQVLHLMRLVTTDLKYRQRKTLGAAEVEEVQEFARQILRLQFVRGLRG